MSTHLTTNRAASPTPANARNALHAAMMALTKKHGIDFFLVTTFPRGDRVDFPDNLLATNWPRDWIGYDGFKEIVFRDGALHALNKTLLPQSIKQLSFDSWDRASRHKLFVLLDRGFEFSVGFPLYDSTGTRYLVIVSSQKDISKSEALPALLYDLISAFDVAQVKSAERVLLTNRELDCLRWAAAGKSSLEIAMIIYVSEHTVNGHLKSALAKLNCVNRVQAVAKASKLNLI